MPRKYRSAVITNILLLLAGLCSFSLFLAEILASSAGLIPEGQVQGFAVDSSGNLYIGRMNRIYVYQDGILLREIRPPTSRSYCFYIENDQLILACASDGLGGVFDLEGRELSYGELSYNEVRTIAKQKSITVNGHLYKISDNFGISPYRITRDGVEIHRMSNMDYLFHGLPYIVIHLILWFIIVCLILIKVSDYQAAKQNGDDVWKAIWG